MFKQIATSLFARRAAGAVGPESKGLTRSELQDLFRTDLEVQNRCAVENTGRHPTRRPQICAA